LIPDGDKIDVFVPVRFRRGTEVPVAQFLFHSRFFQWAQECCQWLFLSGSFCFGKMAICSALKEHSLNIEKTAR